MADMSSVLSVVIRGTDEASGPLRNVSGALTSLGETAHHAGGFLGEMASSLAQGLLIGAGFMVFDDLAHSIEGVVTSAGNFQQAMQNVQNNTTMTTPDVKAMHDAVLTLANETGAPLEQLTSGFQHVMNITGSTASSLDILRIATESAVSTGGNASDTANVLANAMHEYGVDTLAGAEATGKFSSVLDAANGYMGVFHLAAAEGNLTLEQFSESSGKAIGIAANLGVPIEQVSAAFVALTKHGFDAAGAGVQVTDALTHMIKPTAATVTELERVSKLTGIDLVSDFSAAGVHTKGLTGILGDLHDAFTKMGLSEADVEGETMKLVNAQRGGLGVATLLGTGAKDYASILADVSDKSKIANVTSDALARTQATLAGQWNILKDHIQTSSIELGERFLPALTAAVGFITGSGLQGISDFGKSIGQTFLPALRAVGDALSTAFGGVSGSGMLAGLRGMASELTDDLLPRFSAWIIVTSQKLTPALTALVGFVRSEVVPAFQQIGSFIQGTVLPAWGQLLDAFGKLGTAAQQGIGALLGVLAGLEASWIGELAKWGQALIGWIAPMIPLLLTALGDLLGKLGDWITSTALPAIVTHLQRWGAALWQWVQAAVPPLLVELGTLAGQLLGWLGDTLPLIAAQLLAWGKAFVSWVGPQIDPLLHELGLLLGQGIAWMVGTALPSLVVHLVEWGVAFVKWVAPIIPPLLLELGKVLIGLTAWIITTAAPAALSAMVQAGASMVSGLLQGLAPLGAQLMTFLTGVINGIHIDIGPFHLSAAGFHIDSPPAISVVTNHIDNFVGNAASGVGGAVSSHLPTRALGGPVLSGQAYIVGETQPELFIPDTNGMIIPSLPSNSGGFGGFSGGAMGGQGFDYPRFGREVATAMASQPITITMNSQRVAEIVRTELLKQQRSNTTLGFR